MSPEERSLLQSTHELAEQNNKILRSLQRTSRISTIMTVLYWVAIIGLSFGAFYFITPYLKFLTGIAGSPGSSMSQNLQDLLR